MTFSVIEEECESNVASVSEGGASNKNILVFMVFLIIGKKNSYL